MASVDAIVNFGRGASFGLSDTIANWIVPGASCTVSENSFDQFLGGAATTLLGGEALGALLRSGRLGEFLADETGSFRPFARTTDELPRLDATGKVHGPLPTSIPSEWTTSDLQEFADDLRTSIQTREAEALRLGEDGPHSARLYEERQLLRQIEKRLSGS
jgi:hypothetical protein